MRVAIGGFATGLALLVPGQVLGQESIDRLATLFGAPPTVLDISISPSGKKIAYLTNPNATTEIVNVADLSGGAAPVAILADNDPQSRLRSCEWTNESRIACSVRYIIENEGLLLNFTRYFAMDDKGGNIVLLTSEDSRQASTFQQFGGQILALDIEGRPDGVLMSRDWIPDFMGASRVGETGYGLGVEMVDTATGKRFDIEKPDSTIVDYVADETGRVRLKVRQPLDSDGYRKTERSYLYRTANSDNWNEIALASEFFPVAVDAVRNLAYGFVTTDGFDAAASLSLDGQNRIETLVSRNDVDVDEFIRIGRQRRVVGASYATEKREIVYFDDSLKKLAADLQAALPGNPQINLAGASADENRLLIVASSDVDPGMIYLYDKGSRQLSELLPVRAGMEGRTMGKMQPISFPAADGTQIPGYLTLPPESAGKNLPAIVLPHGGPNARDEWGFDWMVQFFIARGYAVLQPNYRGSAGYGSAWFGRNGYQEWRVAVGDVNDAGRWLVSQEIADPQKLAVVGWSYGGYAALQSQVLDPALYKAVVAIAPVTDLEALREESRRFTSFRVVSQMIGDGPHIREGSPARNADSFSAPVLLIHGERDLNVAVEQSQLMKSRLEAAGKSVKYVEYGGRDHYLDDITARANMLKEIDGFLAGALAP